jgi:hypothetical protein
MHQYGPRVVDKNPEHDQKGAEGRAVDPSEDVHPVRHRGEGPHPLTEEHRRCGEALVGDRPSLAYGTPDLAAIRP